MAKKLFNQTAAVKKLQADWEQKLEAKIKTEEFDDIQKIKSEHVLWPQVFKTQKSQYDGGSSYYELCQSILREFRFKKDIHRVIFELHSNGKPERFIKDWIKDRHKVEFSQQGINVLINRIKESYLKGAG